MTQLLSRLDPYTSKYGQRFIYPYGTWVESVITGLIVAFMLWNVVKSVRQGHGLFCAFRRIVIDIAK